MNSDSLSSDLFLARRLAFDLQVDYPGLFHRLPVRPTRVAKALGFRVVRRTNFHQRAQLELFKTEDNKTSVTIVLEEHLDPQVGRFAVAHEIGHALLIQSNPKVLRDWTVTRRERFANLFASEVLVPHSSRHEIEADFRETKSARDILKLAARIGLSVHALFTLADRHPQWWIGLNKILLRIKYVPNARTGFGTTFRIVSAHYDRGNFFVPLNQSMKSFCGNDDWLRCAQIGVEAHRSATILLKRRRPFSETPRFVGTSEAARLSAVRLRTKLNGRESYFVALVDFRPKPDVSEPVLD